MTKINLIQLSKTLAHALRHAPSDYGLSLDAEGWVHIEKLLEGLARHAKSFSGITVADLEQLIESSEKKRFEISKDRIRAVYGHSTTEKVEKTPSVPPEFLYHGTSPEAAALIAAGGLQPMTRQYVHLSADVETAHKVGSRKAKKPIILKVKALLAYQSGILFYDGNDNTWLAAPVPARFIEFPG